MAPVLNPQAIFMWLVSPRWMGRTLTAVQSREPAACTACIWRKAHCFLINESDLSASLYYYFSCFLFLKTFFSPFNNARDLLNVQLWLNSFQACSDNDKLSSFPLLQRKLPNHCKREPLVELTVKEEQGFQIQRWNRVNNHVAVSRTICLLLAK